MEEKRSAVRWNIVLPMRYSAMTMHRECASSTQDVSTTGIKFVTSHRHNCGDHLKMILDLPNADGGPLSMDAEVVWQQETSKSREECNYLVGVVFRKICDHFKKNILNYVNTNYPEQLRTRWWDGV